MIKASWAALDRHLEPTRTVCSRPEVSKDVNDRHQNVLKPVWLIAHLALVAIGMLLDLQPIEDTAALRPRCDRDFVYLMSGPRPPQPESTGPVQMREPSDLHVEASQTVSQQLHRVGIQTQSWR
jgi:hypothetical protein